MKLISTQSIWQNNQHNAFTDLVEYQGRYFCCFRQATNHVSKDGIVRILVSDDLENWQLISTESYHLADLRDPKLTIHPSGKLLLTYYRKRFTPAGQCIANENCVSFSTTAISWSQPKVLGENNWWLWRYRFYQNTGLAIAYNRSQNTVHLYQGDPLASFHKVKDPLFSLSSHGKGYPNESDILFTEDGTAICILRRDADSFSAQLGIAKLGYQNWQWYDLAEYVGGPAMLRLSNGKIIVAGRRWIANRLKKQLTTWIFELDLDNKKLIPLLELESAGDNSYPAMIEKQGKLYVSYYSQHSNRKCAIYLASIDL
ncbi:hypothetical protein [Catenovulum maritimum]|uniref:Uncharacterized protein n=1 Tax=Catenovulum maritimum TaxID=1513271 RepID=A0A0J8GU69_9ALTE|nr:hypothetical protein [Catenovulum maritimum]KMT66287.1 hypothetical protein XM47_04665 [Catenovulum maritimum]